jgi:D-xylose 1-dehydrogenase (NADP+, D-xylono-1,5-lactone-forming)
MRLGLLSTATINRALLDGAPQEVEIAAVASRDGARAQAYASEHGIARSHGSYEALLEDASTPSTSPCRTPSITSGR